MEDAKPVVCLCDGVEYQGHCKEELLPAQKIEFTDNELQVLRARFRLVTLRDLEDNDELLDQVQGLTLSNFPAIVEKAREWIPRLPNLKAIAGLGSGYEYILPRLRQFGVPYSNCPDVHTPAVADHTMSFILATGCGLLPGIRAALLSDRPHYLPTAYRSAGVCGATLGIVGLGSIGLAVARRAKGFNMEVLYCGRTRKSDEVEKQLGCTFCESVDEMLPLCDFVVLCCELNNGTLGLIGKKQFKLMKKSASLINVARGKVVDTEALVEALRTGQIRQAALDVTDPEPLPPGHPLLGQDNIIVTPHIAAFTSKGMRGCLSIAAVNLEAALIHGKPMPNEIIPGNVKC